MYTNRDTFDVDIDKDVTVFLKPFREYRSWLDRIVHCMDEEPVICDLCETPMSQVWISWTESSIGKDGMEYRKEYERRLSSLSGGSMASVYRKWQQCPNCERVFVFEEWD